MRFGPRRALLRAAHRSQAGVSLIEALIVVVIASAVVLVIAYGLQVSVETDGRTNRQQRMNLALSTLTDGLRRVDYESCDGSAGHRCPNDTQDSGGRTANALVYESLLQSQVLDADPTAAAALNGITWTVDSVDYWQPVGYATVTDPSASTTSIEASGGGFDTTFNADSGSQRITITVSMGGETLTGSTVKRTRIG